MVGVKGEVSVGVGEITPLCVAPPPVDAVGAPEPLPPLPPEAAVEGEVEGVEAPPLPLPLPPPLERVGVPEPRVPFGVSVPRRGVEVPSPTTP